MHCAAPRWAPRRSRSSASIARTSPPLRVSGASPASPTSTTREPAMKTVSEQITAFQAKKQALEDSALAIVQKSIDEARTLDKAEEEARQTAVSEAKAVGDHLIVLKQTEQLMLARAEQVN